MHHICKNACSRHLRIHFLVWNCVLCFFVFKLKLHWYFARNGSVNDMASLVGTMAWHTSGAKPLSRANGGIVYWRIKGVTKTRWLNVNKLINVVAFRVVFSYYGCQRGPHFEIATIFHTCLKLIFSISCWISVQRNALKLEFLEWNQPNSLIGPFAQKTFTLVMQVPHTAG